MQTQLKNIVKNLQQDILRWEGHKPATATQNKLIDLGEVEDVFPSAQFPTGTVQEFVCGNIEQAVASSAFISGLLGGLMQKGGACLWIGSSPIYPHGLTNFGIQPDRIVFINLKKSKDILWAMEEALKCTGVVAVVGEVNGLDFKQSRRLQLAVEKSGVTGFVMRNLTSTQNNTACAVRWHISALPSQNENGLPGVGYYKWRVELLKVRNGQTGVWTIAWAANQFSVVKPYKVHHIKLKVG